MSEKKKLKFDPSRIKAQLDKNKEKSKKREKTPIEENSILKVAGPGKYKFRATYDPHSEDPGAEPFRTRFYHFGIPRVGPVYCPQKNDGEDCTICDFLWKNMKELKGNKEAQKPFSSKLPKARVWIPGKLRGERGEEGVKLLSIGTREDEMSKTHKKIMDWFFDEDTCQWLDPDDGIDMELIYEEYDEAKSAMLRAKFGFEGADLARKASPFEGDFDAFMESIPDIDNSPEDETLKAYRKRTPEEVDEIFRKWRDKEGVKAAPVDRSDVDTDDDGDEEVSEEDVPVSSNSGKSSLEERLRGMGLKV